MDTTKIYLVSCGECGGERRVKIRQTPLGAGIDWLEDGAEHKIVSFRERLDSQWGWQCLCGNNDLMTEQEKDSIQNPSSPKPQEVKQIVDNLKVQQSRFNVKEL